jgi:hypothetical protein
MRGRRKRISENFRKLTPSGEDPLVRSKAFALLLAVAACGAKAPAESAPGPQPSSQPSGRSAQVVHATILANACHDLGPTNGKLAEKAMYELVEGCSSVPGGTSQFGATLLPGGRIEIAAAAGQPDVVPICILKHPLLHRVPLSKPCRLDVKIEQTSVSVGGDGGSP